MNKSELKKIAIESMSESGALLREGNAKDALKAAQQAWSVYYELQKMRDEDEDFSDLIYAAHDLYEKCEKAVKQQEDEEFDKMMHLKKLGEEGDYNAAMQAAEWLIDDNNWSLIDKKYGAQGAYLRDAVRLYNSVYSNSEVWMEYRAYAACRIAQMFKLPKYANVDMATSFKFYQWAADRMLELEYRTDNILQTALNGAVETACYSGDETAAFAYAQKGIDNGSDMGIYYDIALYGWITGKKMAGQLVDAMVDAGCWEGMLLKGIIAMRNVSDGVEGAEEVVDEMLNKMAKYGDENPDTYGGKACMAFCVFKMFLDRGLDFLDSDMMDLLRDGVKDGNDWCYNYYGQLCDLVATVSQDEEQVKAYKDEAQKYLCLGACDGNREALKRFIYFLEDNNYAPQVIDEYKTYGRQYKIDA